MSTVTLNISGFATLISYLGIAFLVGFWLYKSRTFKGLLFTVGGVAVIYFAQASDRKPEHLAGILVFALVIGGLLLATWALVRARSRNRIRRVSARERVRHARLIERARERDARRAAQAEREAEEIPVGPRTRQGRTATPAQRAPRQRNGYVVVRGQRSESNARAAGLK